MALNCESGNEPRIPIAEHCRRNEMVVLGLVYRSKDSFPPPLSPYATFFILIYLCHTINNDYVCEAMIMNFLEHIIIE
jgi:hypothetical protein